MTVCPYAYRIVGTVAGARRLVDADAAFAAYVSCDDRAQISSESYLSAFVFGNEFRDRADAHGELCTKGFSGVCWAHWLWFDIDRENNLQAALDDTRHLASFVAERYQLGDDDLLVFYSGSKGFHVGLPTCLWNPPPTKLFNRIAKRFALTIAEQIGITIDSGVYDKVRAFRAPNSRHPKTGRYKRLVTIDELIGLSLDAILKLAEQPCAFELPNVIGCNDQAVADWYVAEQATKEQAEADARRRTETTNNPMVNRQTLEFIREGATTGDRHRLLFSAAANLGEFGCSPTLAHELLTPAALDCGLTPSDVRRQIECGLAHVAGRPPIDTHMPADTPSAPKPNDVQNELADLWKAAAYDAEQRAESDAIAWEGSQHWTPEKLAKLDLSLPPKGGDD